MLTDIQMGNFHRDGFIVIPSALPKSEVLKYRELLKKTFESSPDPSLGDSQAVRSDVISRCQALADLFFSDPVLNSLKSLLGEKFVVLPETARDIPGSRVCLLYDFAFEYQRGRNMTVMVREQTGTFAIFGGRKVIDRPFRRYNPVGDEEVAAVMQVLESGVLSQFLGAWHLDFYGGPEVRAFEQAAETFFGVKHTVTVNSLTSGLITEIGAVGVEPGDEVIVSPSTMSASATAILNWNAIPVFADIEPETFCIDPALVEANISSYTRAIIAVDIFGQSADIGGAESGDLTKASSKSESVLPS